MGECIERLPKKKHGDSPEEKFVANVSYGCLALSVSIAVVFYAYFLLGGKQAMPLTYIKCGMLAGTAILALLHIRFFGVSFCFKIFCSVVPFCLCIFTGITGRPQDTWHMLMVLVLDLVLILKSDEDARIMDRLSIVLLIGFVVYAVLHNLSESGQGPDIHPIHYDSDDALYTNLFCNITPVLLNFKLVQSYGRDLRSEARSIRISVQAASDVGNALVDFDLDEAHSLMACMEKDSLIFEPMMKLINNLRTYRPFLPAYLFPQAPDSEVSPTNRVIAGAMSGSYTSWSHAKRAVEKLRDPDYSLNDFREDVEIAFPELQLYHVEAGRTSRSSGLCSSGRTGHEEY
jgi:hypothetical protein